MGTMLSLCDRSGVMARPWAAAGHTTLAVDLDTHNHTDDHGVTHINADILTWQPPATGIVFVAAFPPCDALATAGARHFRDKGLAGLIAALQVVEACRIICENSDAPWMIENPRSTLATHWRPADHWFHPWMYGDGYRKYTSVWSGGGFRWPKPRPVPVTREHKISNAPQSGQRKRIRSLTPAGFAQAVFDANNGVNAEPLQPGLW